MGAYFGRSRDEWSFTDKKFMEGKEAQKGEAEVQGMKESLIDMIVGIV